MTPEKTPRSLKARDTAWLGHPDRLTPDEIEAVYRQVMRRQAATMRAAKTAKRTAAAEQNAGAEA